MAKWKFLVTIDAGLVFHFARTQVAVEDDILSKTYNFVPGILEISPPVLGVDNSEAEVTISNYALNLPDLHNNGVVLNGAKAEISLWKEGQKWEQRKIILAGRVSPTGVSRSFDRTQLTLTDYAEHLDVTFPPWKITREVFPNVEDQHVGNTMPVIYGHSREIPLIQLDKIAPDSTEVKYLLAGHTVFSPSVLIRPSGEDEDLFYNFVFNQTDGSGANYSFVKLDPTNDEISGSTNMTGELTGHKDASGYYIANLADVILHAIKTYSKLPAERIDHYRFTKFKEKTNNIVVSSIFGGSQTETLLSTLKSRYESQFNIQLSWRNGKLGADSLTYNHGDPVIKRLELNRNMLGRVDPVTTNLNSPPNSSFSVAYDMNILVRSGSGNPKYRKVLTKDRTNDELCKQAFSYFGDVPLATVELSDIADKGAANVVLNRLVEQNAVLRTKVTYQIKLDEIINFPLFEKYLITDSDMGWTDEPFRLDAMTINENDTADCQFTSYNFLP